MEWPDADHGVYAISVASELSGVHPQTLRLYEREGLVNPARSQGGTRRYSGEDVERMRLIAALTGSGLNLAGVKRVLAMEEELADLREPSSIWRRSSLGAAARRTRGRCGMADEDSGRGFSHEQRSGLQARQADQDRTLAAMHRLEAALSDAATKREAPWRDAVVEALGDLEAVSAEEATNAERPDSLLADLSRNQPRMRNRARALRLQYAKLRDTIGDLHRELGTHAEDTLDVADIRERLGWVLTALRHQRARESDLIYEAYYDAFNDELHIADPGEAAP